MKDKVIAVSLSIVLVINTAAMLVISELATPDGLVKVALIAACSSIFANQLIKAIGLRRRKRST